MCIFCQIANKEKEAAIEFEDDEILVFEDIHPKAPVHLLIIPKKHLVSVKEAREQDRELLGQIILTAKKVAEKRKLKGYKIEINVGREGGQIINHLHAHLLSN